MKRLLLTVTTALLLSVGAALAGPTEDGNAAYERGDYAEAVRQFRLGAAQGNVHAQTLLGLAYDRGEGVTKDYAEAVKWYRLASMRGYAIAQASLGDMYRRGLGVPQDDAEAIKWFRLAAAQGLRSRKRVSVRCIYTGKVPYRTMERRQSATDWRRHRGLHQHKPVSA